MNVPNSILVKGGNIKKREGFYKADILVRDGVIEKIADNISCEAECGFSAEGMTVSAGLVDFHTHIKNVSPDHIGIEPEKISYPFGVTHLVDASTEIGERKNAERDWVDISALAAVGISNNRADFSNVERMLERYGDKVIGIKVYLDTGFVDIKDATPLANICEYGKTNGLFVMAHTTNSPVPMREIVSAMNPGDVISHAFHGGEYSAAEDGFECLKTAKDKGVLLDAAFAAYYHVDYSLLSNAAKLGILPDVLSTDLTKGLEFFENEKYGVTTVMDIAEKCGISEDDVFKAVAEIPRKHLRTSGDNCGYIAEGQTADIAVFEKVASNSKATDRFGNTVVFDSRRKCVLTVFGKQVYFN